MTTQFFEEAVDALHQHLATFAYGLAFEIRWGNERYISAYGVSYIEVNQDMSEQATQDQGGEVRTRTEGKYKLKLKVPELHGRDGVLKLYDALAEHFMPGGQPVAYSFDNALDKQAAHVLRKPRMEGEIMEEGSQIICSMTVDFFLTPQREI